MPKEPHICGWMERNLVCWMTYPHQGLHVSKTGVLFDKRGCYGEGDPPPLAQKDKNA